MITLWSASAPCLIGIVEDFSYLTRWGVSDFTGDYFILLWALADDPRLSSKARKLIENAAEIYVSALAQYTPLAIQV